ncbi:Rho guanine nucleotide exchange factor 8-like protein [Tanacetum coccineum]
MTLTDDQETIVNGNDPVSLIKRKRGKLEQMKERFAKLLLGADYIVEFVPVSANIKRRYDDETKRRPTDEHSYFKEARRDAHFPPERLSEESRKWMQYQKDCVNQVLKASMAINAEILAEVEIPENYIENLPKNGRESLGDAIYKNITVEFFDPRQFLSTMDLSSDINVLDLKNKIEASIVIWKSKMHQKDSKCLLEFGEKRAL